MSTCGSCKYGKFNGVHHNGLDKGECFRFPPVITSNPTRHCAGVKRPSITRGTPACGEYKLLVRVVVDGEHEQ